MEENKMKIKKGTEVRIRRTNEIGTIKEVELIRKNGIVNKYCHVVTNNGKQDLWLDSSELTDITETCVVRFANSDGQYLTLTVALNHKVQDVRVEISEGIPQNLKEHDGLHIYLLNQILAKMTREYRDVEINGD